MSFPFSMQVWGSLRAPHRALLLHGGTESATSWSRVAAGLVQAGYRVDAPDLDGHGWTRVTHDDYDFRAYADHIANNLEPEAKYDVLAGISLGSMAALYTYGQLHYKPRKLILIEPPMGTPPVALPEPMLARIVNPPTLEEMMKAGNRTLIETSADRLGLLQLDIDALRAAFKNDTMKNHDDLPGPDESKGTIITILAADPDHRSLYPKSNVERIKSESPHVRLAWVPGTGHAIHKEKPEAILQVILQDGLEKSEFLEPLHV